MAARLLRMVVTIAIVQTATLGAASAQHTDGGAPSPTEAAEAAPTDSAADPNAPLDALDALDAVQETWEARVEYHRLLRRVDLSELSAGASTLGYGIYSLTRDEPFSRGMGGALLAGGGVHLVSGIVFTIRSQRGLSPATAPASFAEGDPVARELEEMEHKSDVFIAYLLSDTSAITGGITTALLGIARDKPVTQGVGLGVASQGVLTLVLDLMHQNQGRVYLRTLRDLQLRVRVDRATAGNGAIATFGWVL